MMRNLTFTLILSLVCSSFVFGQDIVLSTDSASTTDSLFRKAKLTITNNGATGRTLYWKKLSDTFSAGWDSSGVCDDNLCSFDSEGDYNLGDTVQPGQTGKFEVQFQANNVNGNGMTVVALYDPMDSSATVVVGTFSSNLIYPNSSIKETHPDLDITLAPNPAKDVLNIQTKEDLIRTIEIYNMAGEQVGLHFSLRGSTTQTVPISDLTQGVYLLRFMDADQQLLRTKRFVVAQ